jgi:hypothetical protein
MVAMSLWAAFGYLNMTRMSHQDWLNAHAWWSSAPVVVLMFCTLSWSRRTPEPSPEEGALRPAAALPTPAGLAVSVTRSVLRR